jgi:Winged helix-turn-helix domain (DUF2582)
MAKSKSASPTNSASPHNSKGNRTTAPEGREAPAAAKRDRTTRNVLANESIGHVAGEVWQLLDGDGEQSLPAIKKAVDAPDDMILAAIGWLAREDKLSFSKSGRSLTISLR